MHNIGKQVLGTACHLDVAFHGTAKYRPCQDLEVIAEAIEVIYAFATGLEPTEVRAAQGLRGCQHVPIDCSCHALGIMFAFRPATQ